MTLGQLLPPLCCFLFYTTELGKRVTPDTLGRTSSPCLLVWEGCLRTSTNPRSKVSLWEAPWKRRQVNKAGGGYNWGMRGGHLSQASLVP